MEFDLKEGLLLVITLVIAFYLVAYSFSPASQVVSNSTGLWGNINAKSPGVFPIAAIIVPLVGMLCIVVYLIKKALE